ncbi:autotransporter domain-containing protein [Salmonella enterica]
MFKRNKLSAFIILATSTSALFTISTASAEDYSYKDKSDMDAITTGNDNDNVIIDNSYISTPNDKGYMVDTGDGDDTLTISNYQDGKISDNSIFNTGNGNDVIVFNAMLSDDNQPSLDGANFQGGDGNDTIIIENNPYLMHFTMDGGQGNDTLQLNNIGNATLAILIGGEGDDTLFINNSTCTQACYLDGDDNAHGITGGNNQLIISNSNVSIGEAYDLTDDDGKYAGTVSGGINNFNDVEVTNNSSITIGGDSENTYNDDGNIVTAVGGIGNVGEINVSHNSSITIDGTAADSLEDTDINVSSDSSFTINGKTDANLEVDFSTLSQPTTNNAGITYSTENKDSVNVAFANGQQSVTARSGAYNYNADIVTTESSTNNDSLSASDNSTITASVQQEKTGLANDVQGAIAGLDAAKQSNNAIADSINAHINTLNNINIMHGIQKGTHIWGDFLYQNGNFQDDVNYKSVLQGTQSGIDWTSELSNGDSLTGGVALGYVRNKTNHADNAGHFNNDVYGNYYSVYGGWQQNLRDTGWGLFANGSFSYGDMRYSMSGSNVSNQTTGSQQSYSSSYDGDAYNIETHAGINFVLPSQTLIQPYVMAGWNKVTADSFSESGINFSKNDISVWNAGAGMRVTTELNMANISLMPWADAHYQAEFSDDSDFTAADYHMSEGNNQKVGMFGLGVNAGLNKDLTFNFGTWYGTGDVDSDVSVQAGLNYHF